MSSKKQGLVSGAKTEGTVDTPTQVTYLFAVTGTRLHAHLDMTVELPRYLVDKAVKTGDFQPLTSIMDDIGGTAVQTMFNSGAVQHVLQEPLKMEIDFTQLLNVTKAQSLMTTYGAMPEMQIVLKEQLEGSDKIFGGDSYTPHDLTVMSGALLSKEEYFLAVAGLTLAAIAARKNVDLMSSMHKLATYVRAVANGIQEKPATLN